MGRPRRTVVPLDAEATSPRTEALDAPAPGVGSPLTPVEPEAVPAQPERSSARQKLADAIAEVAALDAEIAEAAAAVAEADQAKWKTASVLSDAEEALERAKPRPYGALKPREPWTFASQEDADAYNAKLNEPPPSIEWAKEAVAKATDARDTALTAAQFHRQRLDKATDRLSWKRSSIDSALRLAVHFDPATAALAAETKRLVTAAAAAKRAFETAMGTSFLQPDHQFYGATDPTNPRIDPEGWAILQRWNEALDALKTDPDAPLPKTSAA